MPFTIDTRRMQSAITSGRSAGGPGTDRPGGDVQAAFLPLVSIVIPTYNAARFLAASIESALNQSYRRTEIIVVDDGSTDETALVLGRHGARIRTIRQPNQGVAAARNSGIRASHGELIGFLDADDIWDPRKIASQVVRFENPAVGLVHCGVEYIGEAGEVRGTNLAGRSGEVLQDIALLKGAVVQGGGSGSVIRAAVFEKVGLFDERLSTSADWDMWRRVACHYEIDMIREPLVKYRLHSGSMHQNVATFERDMLYAFGKMFSDPAARRVHHLHRRAYAALYVMLCGSYFQVRSMPRCFAYAARSIVTWPPSLSYLAALPIRVAQRRTGMMPDMREPTVEHEQKAGNLSPVRK